MEEEEKEEAEGSIDGWRFLGLGLPGSLFQPVFMSMYIVIRDLAQGYFSRELNTFPLTVNFPLAPTSWFNLYPDDVP